MTTAQKWQSLCILLPYDIIGLSMANEIRVFSIGGKKDGAGQKATDG
jgi:hypothetical protein